MTVYEAHKAYDAGTMIFYKGNEIVKGHWYNDPILDFVNRFKYHKCKEVRKMVFEVE